MGPVHKTSDYHSLQHKSVHVKCQHSCCHNPPTDHAAHCFAVQINAEKFAEAINLVGAERVSAICTDNASNMTSARSILCSMPGFEHILQIRCWMHALALVLGSLLSHDWAKNVVRRVQTVVTYIRSSHRPLHALRELTAAAGVKGGGLHTSNTTRLTSVLLMTRSVQRLEIPLRNLLTRHQEDTHPAGLITKPEVRILLADPSFWTDISVLNEVAEPCEKAVMAMQRYNSQLADVTRYFLYIRQCLLEVLPKVLRHAPGKHCCHGSCMPWVLYTAVRAEDRLLALPSQSMHGTLCWRSTSEPERWTAP